MPFGYLEVPGDRFKAEQLKQRLSHDIFRHLSLRLMKMAEFEQFNKQVRVKTLLSKKESILNNIARYKLIPDDMPIRTEHVLELRQEAFNAIKGIDAELSQLGYEEE